MGIRFACPNGHPLHVKTELAGRRGICPECQVRFVIPAPEGVNATAAAQATSGSTTAAAEGQPPVVESQAAQTVAHQADPRRTPAGQAKAAPPDSAAPPDNAAPQLQPQATTPAAQASAEVPMWYIRPAVGGQFGPADDAMVQQWTAEGRIGADAYVWRTGWANWRLASEVPAHFPQLAGQTVAAAPLDLPNEYNIAAGAPGGPGAVPADVSVATARYQRRKQRSARGQLLAALVLIVLAAALAGVLFWVIQTTINEPEPTPPAAAAPATTNSPADNGQETGEPEIIDEPADPPE